MISENKKMFGTRYIRNIMVNGVIYPNVIAASEETGLGINLLRYRVKLAKYPEIHYTDTKLPTLVPLPDNEGRAHTKASREKYREAAMIRESKRRKSVSVMGTVYPTMRSAALALEINPATMIDRVKNPNFPDYFLVEENQ